MPSNSPALSSFRRALRAFAGIAIAAATFAASGCKPSIHEDVYSLASEHSRVIASALIAPGDGAEYAFTMETIPTIEIVSPVSGATAWYSINGGGYRAYEGPFALPVADPKVDQTITVTAYLSHPDYRSSDPVAQSYRFVATAVPSPTISASEEPTSYHFYYHYDSLPTITATCALPSATIWYSRNGGASYEKYTGPFTLPVTAGTDSIATYTLTMYATAEGYGDSPVTSESFRFAKNGTIVTIAGTGTPGFHDGNATTALFDEPYGLYVDAGRNVYVADFNNSRIRMIAPDGTVSTVAGDGVAGFFGEGVYATTASLNRPMSITVDETNNILYIADTSNVCVRAVSLDDGMITTYAGQPGVVGGLTSPELQPLLSGAFRSVVGLAYHADHGLVMTDAGWSTVWELTPLGIVRIAGDNTSGTTVGSDPLTSHVGNIHGVTWDGYGNLHIVDIAQNAILKVTAPGTGSAAISLEYVTLPAVNSLEAICSSGNDLYFTEPNKVSVLYNGTVLAQVAGDGTAGYSGDGGPATAATLNAPMGVYAISGDGVYISDTDNHRIRKVILY